MHWTRTLYLSTTKKQYICNCLFGWSFGTQLDCEKCFEVQWQISSSSLSTSEHRPKKLFSPFSVLQLSQPGTAGFERSARSDVWSSDGQPRPSQYVWRKQHPKHPQVEIDKKDLVKKQFINSFPSSNTSQHWNGSNPIHIKQEIQIPQVKS